MAKKQYVVVRTYSAGVHVGTLEGREGTDLTLSDARRIWRWRGANTLNEIALHGLDDEYCKVSEPVPSILLTEAIEIIPASKEAQEKLSRMKWGQ